MDLDLRNINFDLLFIDLDMPIKNGWETAKDLRDMQYKGCLIALSAYHYEQGESCVSMFDYFLEKPVFLS